MIPDIEGSKAYDVAREAVVRELDWTNQSRARRVGCVFGDGSPHMVPPPAGPTLHVCCNATAGPIAIAVHPAWAPRGAQRFLKLVDDGHFDAGVPLFRCLRNFICQFGLGAPSRNRRYRSIPDDPQWLPPGPANRVIDGRKRFPKGYLAYAGAGPNSRNIQLILALADDGRLAGGSPWEVPWGQVVGPALTSTLPRIYTGYGDRGPRQAHLAARGVDAGLKTAFPRLDYITSCFKVGSTPYSSASD
ncbi:hypothetical protein CTAYLR_006309 [Chrysophaeum taylorii]|uniref:PPIase cyclophilin-type domain-containing protein n=1 Tax=Chrysophaeum taylorii TaxID=2483200 RepID=A0AAD7XGW1_9STRA|nr:hypothetical protein CTAYLR_006309 [Chrysophaeum taylorii]